MLTNRYLDEQNDLLISIYKEKMSSENGLNLFLTSGNNLCTDINTQNDYCDINIIKCIISCLKKYNLVNFKTIFIDSNYIDSDNVTYIENELKGNIIVNTFNGQNVKKYEQYQIHNYIDDIKYYNKEALNKYILNDNNVDLDIIGKDNLEIIENDLTYFTDEIAQLLT